MLAAALSGMKGIPDIPWWLIGGGVVGVFLLIGQAYAEYQHRAYDPTWAFKFDERFYGGEIKDSRCKAANVLKNNRGNLRRTDTDLEDIDDLLVFLEDIGFFVQGDQISPEVAHHHFYHWIRGYYLASRPYIEAWQANTAEPPRWKHIEKLFGVTSEIETKGGGRDTLTGEKILEFLDQEINACCKVDTH